MTNRILPAAVVALAFLTQAGCGPSMSSEGPTPSQEGWTEADKAAEAAFQKKMEDNKAKAEAKAAKAHR